MSDTPARNNYESETHADPALAAAAGSTTTKLVHSNSASVAKGIRWRKRVTRALLALTILVTGGLIFVFVIVPWFQPPVDPNLAGPKIEHGVTHPEYIDEADRRNSITDLLFQKKYDNPDHPLDPLLEVAQVGLDRIRKDIRDYTFQMVKQERVGKKLNEEAFMFCKVRREHQTDGRVVPKSIYLNFLKPRSLAGQEAIWVANRNNGKLIGHPNGIFNVKRFHLKPTGWVAMQGNRYPITELGFEVLLKRMMETGKHDRNYEECEITIDRDLKINDNACTLITVTHPVRRDHFEFHIAKIYIDDVQNIPIGYEGFLWPDEPGGRPKLIEKYFYQDVKINVGLTDMDFDPDNPEYNYR